MSSVEIKSWPFDNTALSTIENDDFVMDYPVVHFLKNNTTVYIGETVAFKNRMKAHLKNPERRKLDKMTLIFHEKFHRSATYNIGLM